ncbi:hypothetical protein [Candidatus Nasuia deltocephalinicola]|uniref:hypothetical protein n=1 Tax=Candidatus Nasuia deltocephalincola TaxID=1160784 RepID=UPI00216B38DD|nr:hypothetical protein [Candidatus Nasuia deltocephalinicola]
MVYIYKLFIIFIIGLGLNYLNYILFKFINIFYISKIIFYDSLLNINFLNFLPLLSKKIIIGKKFNQKSLFKKTFYLKYKLSLKKFLIISRFKSGDINFYGRVNCEIVYINSFKYFFFIITGITSSISSLNILNFFLTYRINLSNITFITYLNNINIFKFFKCFLNKTVIYYMINNNIFYFIEYLIYDLNIYYIFLCEISNFYSEHFFFFNFYDISKLKIYNNFLFFKYPKYLILNNFLNFINLINFFIFLKF